MSFEAAVHAKAIDLSQLSLDMCSAAGSGHPSSAMSLAHITTVLLYNTMRWVPQYGNYPTSDRLVLSEGHAVPIIYAAFADVGAVFGKGEERRPVTVDDLAQLRDVNSYLDGHPNPMEGFPFFDAATGSLGQGLSVAAGLGIAARHDKLDRRMFCLIGDGESREGQVWEAVDFLVDHGLANVLPIFNCNAWGQASRVSQQQSPDRIAAKLEAAGVAAIVIDGHSPEAIKEAFDRFVEASSGTQVHAIVAKTIKGWGSSTLQGGNWHGKPVGGDKLDVVRDELAATRAKLTSALSTADELRIYPPQESEMPEVTIGDAMSFTEAMKTYDMQMTLHTGKFATRKAFGIALRALGHSNPSVFSLDADVKNSTFSEWFANDDVINDRFIECKIAEQNMISVGVGLSAAHKIPFCSTFAKFVTRAYDQVEMAINSGANVKIIGSHCGVTPAADGPSQMALPDVAWFRSWTTMKDHRGNPGCYILQPADAYAAYGLTVVMAEYEGACYMRTARPDVEFLYDENTVFNLGKFEVLTEGRDLLIVSAGYMVHECNKALDTLDKAGIDATLVDLYSIPFDADALLDLANENGGIVLTVEDNYGGGIGAAVAEACTDGGDAFTVEQMHVRKIPKSARTVDDELRYLGLHHTDIVARASKMLGVVGV